MLCTSVEKRNGRERERESLCSRVEEAVWILGVVPYIYNMYGCMYVYMLCACVCMRVCVYIYMCPASKTTVAVSSSFAPSWHMRKPPLQASAFRLCAGLGAGVCLVCTEGIRGVQFSDCSTGPDLFEHLSVKGTALHLGMASQG